MLCVCKAIIRMILINLFLYTKITNADKIVIRSLNSIYLESQIPSFTEDIRNDFIAQSMTMLFEQFTIVLLSLIMLFFAGMYIGKVLLRPFEVIGEYSISQVEGKETIYNVDLFSDYRLLTNFSDIFFDYVKGCLGLMELSAREIPKHYLGIHKPKFEKVFFVHFFVLIIILSTVSGLFLYNVSTQIHADLIDKLLHILKQDSSNIGYFLGQQIVIFDSIVITVILSLFISYVLLSFHLYSKVSGAIFAFFSTMRSFMRGRFSSRVHLVGYGHIRKNGRAFNKFLDHIERQCSIDHNNRK